MSAPDYRLISCLDGGCARAGILIGDRVIAAAALLGERPGIEWHLPPGTAAPVGRRAPPPALRGRAPVGDSASMAQVDLLAPILYSGTLFCAGANSWEPRSAAN